MENIQTAESLGAGATGLELRQSCRPYCLRLPDQKRRSSEALRFHAGFLQFPIRAGSEGYAETADFGSTFLGQDASITAATAEEGQ